MSALERPRQRPGGRLRPARGGEDDDVVARLETEVFEDDLAGPVVEPRGNQRTVAASPVDVRVRLERGVDAELEFGPGITHAFDPPRAAWFSPEVGTKRVVAVFQGPSRFAALAQAVAGAGARDTVPRYLPFSHGNQLELYLAWQ